MKSKFGTGAGVIFWVFSFFVMLLGKCRKNGNFCSFFVQYSNIMIAKNVNVLFFCTRITLLYLPNCSKLYYFYQNTQIVGYYICQLLYNIFYATPWKTGTTKVYNSLFKTPINWGLQQQKLERFGNGTLKF